MQEGIRRKKEDNGIGNRHINRTANRHALVGLIGGKYHCLPKTTGDHQSRS